MDGIQIFFPAAYQEYRESQETTTANAFQAESQSAVPEDSQAFQQDTVNAIANLATATAADRETVSNVSQTVDTLTNELATSTHGLVTALKKVATLTKDVEY